MSFSIIREGASIRHATTARSAMSAASSHSHSGTVSAAPSVCTGNTAGWVDVSGDGCDWYERYDLVGAPSTVTYMTAALAGRMTIAASARRCHY